MTTGEQYPRELWRCARCHSSFALADNGQLPRHIERHSERFCPSLRPDVCVYRPGPR